MRILRRAWLGDLRDPPINRRSQNAGLHDRARRLALATAAAARGRFVALRPPPSARPSARPSAPAGARTSVQRDVVDEPRGAEMGGEGEQRPRPTLVQLAQG